ncbi:hypothetical protein LWI29_026448 [Acer saccharum]|uniref:Reverse transcriptase domain-containing protein n=1 Tax=Acer saccharum TaxID=4024 RepID=A0AA39VZ13_ACESA|nr:hypothetical protein LWI29_026448 [Acer saccharum]
MIGRRGGRGGRGSHQPPNQHDSPNRERDLRDIEVDDLRRQVQQLQQRLEHFEPLEHDVSRHDSENEPTDEENTNPFGRGYDRASNDGNNYLSVEEYTSEFDNQRMLCDITKPDEQTIARYLGGLRTDISNIVQLQPYWTYNDVVKLSLKVEKQIREGRGGSSRSWIRENNTNRHQCPQPKLFLPQILVQLQKQHASKKGQQAVLIVLLRFNVSNVKE